VFIKKIVEYIKSINQNISKEEEYQFGYSWVGKKPNGYKNINSSSMQIY